VIETMKNNIEFHKIVYYFDNACRSAARSPDEIFLEKVRIFLKNRSPTKMWEEVGIFYVKLKTNVYPDFVIISENKVIACEVELQSLQKKFENYVGLKIFDEIWFFTDIHSEKRHLHYKFEVDLPFPAKFFGLNDVGQVVNIK